MFFEICVSVTIPLIILFLVLNVTKQLFWEPYLRWQLLLIIMPFFVGLTISSLMRTPTFFITGILFTGLIYSWFSIFRFPPAFRTAQKQLKTEQFDEALYSLNQAIKENSTSSELYRLRALVNLSQKYYLHAERDAKKALELNPKFSMNISMLGQIYWSQADFKRAYESYQKAYQLAPKLTYHQINLGIVLYKLKNYAESENLLRKAAKNKKNL